MADLDRDERVVALESLGLESRMARDERKAGIVIAAARARCRVLPRIGSVVSSWLEKNSQLPK
jgi:hypothetical protein